MLPAFRCTLFLFAEFSILHLLHSLSTMNKTGELTKDGLPVPDLSLNDPPALFSKPQAKKGKARKSANSHKRNRLRASAKFIVKVKNHRGEENRFRLDKCGDRGPTIEPQYLPNHERHLTGAVNSSPQVAEFYREHLVENKYLEVSERANVSNPEGKAGGGRGVFAKCNIPEGTRLCPYVGDRRTSACPADVHCAYDLQVDAKIVVCARNRLYDTGYLAFFDESRHYNAVHVNAPCPPNFGRYFNTLQGRRDPLEFNCVFEIVDDGCDAMFIHANRDLLAGEELLVDYGCLFQELPTDHESEPEDFV